MAQGKTEEQVCKSFSISISCFPAGNDKGKVLF
jgi:hypothetical protein